MKQRVGVGGFSYPEARNISSLPLADYEYVRATDVFAIVNSLHQRLLGPTHATSMLNCLHCDFGFNKVDFLHLFNSISYGSHPWLVTFEHYLPRWNVHSERGIRLLAAPACKKVIAMSKFAFEHQCHYLEEFPVYRETIRKKMCILTPPQRTMVETYDEKNLDRRVVTYTFVGSDFFRKGGMEILIAFTRLINDGFPTRLNVVSSMDYGDYASRSTIADVLTAKRLMQALGDNLRFYPKLENADVLKLFIASDVGLLPTYDDTYGFSVLEAQAAGCPVISTDVCALPEINDDAMGWMIPLPKDRFGIAYRHTKDQRRVISSIIQERLYTIMREISSGQGLIREKGVRSLERVKRECRIEDRVTALEALYHQMLHPGLQSVL